MTGCGSYLVDVEFSSSGLDWVVPSPATVLLVDEEMGTLIRILRFQTLLPLDARPRARLLHVERLSTVTEIPSVGDDLPSRLR